MTTKTSELPSRLIFCLLLLLLLCGDIESNPGPAPARSQENIISGTQSGTTASCSGTGLPPSRPSRVPLASVRSAKEKRRREIHIEPAPLWWSCRLVLAVMGFWGFLNVYAMRVNLSVAMVCMINHTATQAATATATATDIATNSYRNHSHIVVNNASVAANGTAAASVDLGVGFHRSRNNASVVAGDVGNDGDDDDVGVEDEGEAAASEDKCGSQSSNSSSSSTEDGEFSWSKETQGLILGSFFWGYMTTQIFGGWLAARYGGKHVYGCFMLGCAVCTLLMPLAARVDYRFLLVLRFLAGVGQGVVFPAMNVLWANWAPPLESSKLGSIGYSGSQVGNVLTFPVAGVLCQYGIDGGWPSIFYLLGGMGILWFGAWCFLVYDSPAEHPRISAEEKAYITASLQGKMTATRKGSSHVPWRTLLTSGPVWGIVITHTCSNFGTYTFLTNIPTYLKEVLHFDIKQNGLLSAVPYIGFWLAIIISGQLADFARSRGYLTTTQARKIGNSLGMLMPGTFVAAVGFMTCQQSTTAVVLLTVGVAWSGFQYGSGWMVNPVDIAPRYAGVIFGISNTMATIPGFLAPIAIGYITKNQTRAEWQIVFFIATAIYTVGAVVYIVLGSGEVQPWARQDDDGEDDEDDDDPSPAEKSQDTLRTAIDDSLVEDPLLTDKASSFLPPAAAWDSNNADTDTGNPRPSRVSFSKSPAPAVDVDSRTVEDQRRKSSVESSSSGGRVLFY